MAVESAADIVLSFFVFLATAAMLPIATGHRLLLVQSSRPCSQAEDTGAQRH